MTDDLDERLSERFQQDTDADDDSDEEAVTSDEQTAMSSETSQNAQKVENIKKEWNVRSFYLDDDLDSDLTTAFKRLDFELSEAETEVDLKKTRHFYPLLVQLGLERLEEMKVTEVTEHMERNDLL